MFPDFQLHQRLQLDSILLGQFDLCQLRLINDSLYRWFILVPQIAGISEIYQLSKPQRDQLAEESNTLAQILAHGFKADKMNIATIGNVVPQLHIHHIVRYKTDMAWPAPVWGKFAAVPYTETHMLEIIGKVQTWLKSCPAIDFNPST